jgi:threonine/homoserine/homoserine lactone efflux protein
MPDIATLGVFFGAALILSLTPGPGMLYVLARTLHGGRREGVLSTLGTGTAGMIHTLASALGLSALFAASAVAFGVVKFAGAGYLIYLGLRTLLARDRGESAPEPPPQRHAYVQGVVTEVLNPKTALFFLAFIPQFIEPSGSIFWQFVLLGGVTTVLTSGADLIVALAAGPLAGLLRSERARRGRRWISGGALLALGAFVAVGDR